MGESQLRRVICASWRVVRMDRAKNDEVEPRGGARKEINEWIERVWSGSDIGADN